MLGSAFLINVLLVIIRVYVLAVRLGPVFFGTISLYAKFINTIGSLTSLAIGQSAVRDIAVAAVPGDEQGMERKVVVLHRVVWIAGIFGLMAAIFVPLAWFGAHLHIYVGAGMAFATQSLLQVMFITCIVYCKGCQYATRIGFE